LASDINICILTGVVNLLCLFGSH